MYHKFGAGESETPCPMRTFAYRQDADCVLRRTDLSECITGVVMVKIFGGVTLVLQSWGRQEQKEMGLAQVEEGVGYALTRPGLMTFPLW